jgi:hypothetical protein
MPLAALAVAPTRPGRAGKIDLAMVVRALRPPEGTTLTNEIAGPVPVPPDVAEAVTGAAREALRNVEDHAKARIVHVCLRRGTQNRLGDTAEGSEGFMLSVTDDGTGFAAGELAVTSVGLRRSVIRRMAAVGGWAEILSVPGHGTTVQLQWCPPSAAPAAEAAPSEAGGSGGTVGRMQAAVGDVRRPLAAVCLPFLAIMGVIAALHTARTPGTGHLLVWYALLSVFTVALLLRAGTGIPRAVAGVACAFAVAGALGSFHVLPLAGLADYTSWPVGAVTPLLTLLVIVRPAWEALTALAVEQIGLVVLVVASAPIAPSAGATAAMVVPALLAPALGVVTGLTIGPHRGQAGRSDGTRRGRAVGRARPPASTFINRRTFAAVRVTPSFTAPHLSATAAAGPDRSGDHGGPTTVTMREHRPRPGPKSASSSTPGPQPAPQHRPMTYENDEGRGTRPDSSPVGIQGNRAPRLAGGGWVR